MTAFRPAALRHQRSRLLLAQQICTNNKIRREVLGLAVALCQVNVRFYVCPDGARPAAPSAAVQVSYCAALGEERVCSDSPQGKNLYELTSM